MVIQLVITTVFPACWIFALWRSRVGSRIEWALNGLALGSFLLFALITGRWDGSSYWLRFILPLAYLAAVAVSWMRLERSRREPHPLATSHWVQWAASVAVVLAFVSLSLRALSGYSYSGDAIEMAYPLKGGLYYVGGGGSSRWINNHTVVESQRYALDIVKLNALGNRARGIAPADLEKYAIFGVPVYSPCEGTVVRAEDGHPDLAPPERDREHLAGNHVVIRTGDVKVLLAHLEKGSVAVKTGDEVVPGQEIGRVGNSGNTSQPHLHIHAERGGSPDSILDGQGVPMRFGDRFLVRNSLFTGTSR